MVAPPLQVLQADEPTCAVDLHAAIVQPAPTQSKPRVIKYLWQLARKGGPAALERMKEVVDDVIILARLQLNAQEPDTGRTALHYAVMNGDDQMTALLAKQRGIDMNIVDNEGYTPVARAVQSGSMPTLIRLLSTAFANTHCAAIDLLLCRPNARECCPMGAAVAAESPDLLDCLLSLVALQQSRSAFRHVRQPSFTGRLSINNLSRTSSSSGKDGASEQSGALKAALLRAPVDAEGRPPLLVALSQHKLAHALVLLEAGASLCTAEPATAQWQALPTTPTTFIPASPPSTQNSPNSSASTSSNSSSAGACWAAHNLPGSTPLHLAVQHVAQLKARLSGAGVPQPAATSAAAAVADSGLLGPTPSAVDSEQLQLACRLLSQMLSHPEFPDVAIMQDCRGDCVLHAAVRAGLVLVVEKIVQRAPNTLALVNMEHMNAMDLARSEQGSTACAEMLQPFYAPGFTASASSAWRMLPRSLSKQGSFKAIQLPAAGIGKAAPSSLRPVSIGQDGPSPSNASSIPSPRKQETKQLIKPPKPGKAKGPTSYSDYDARGVDCTSAVSCLSFAGLGGRIKKI